ncbi:hypothetical protein ncot_00510 [Nocardioides sp. JQ2195]|uniref:hypothetical protein n=1 Tax=Nocardioides sp. JQ2195 TaxID=2592334 RepID=UPI00143EC904|nr:hypothetical protein [Nocardioides sp. JQ2195]QIX25233.1 hypothetical protein ncot_00510 [Nocardioides sp. JQ2195]
MSRTARKVFLHVGAPKTGTTYVQDRLALNLRTLAEHGINLPNRRLFADPNLFHFRAALDLLGQDWGGPPGHAAGAWPTMVKQVRRHTGTSIISHEILAPAPKEKVSRVMNDLQGAEIHIVYSARDLVRQMPAAWQESVKQGRKWSFEKFLVKAERESVWFMRAFDLPTVLSNWSANLLPENVHVVTVPQQRVAGDSLWDRFCQVVGIDPAWAPLESERTNAGMGVAETELLRRLNRRLDRATRSTGAHEELIRAMLERVDLHKSRKVQLPPEHYAWTRAVTERWIEWIEGSGVRVVGDLDDLRTGEPPVDLAPNPNRVRNKKITNAAVHALAAMTNEAARRPDPSRELGSRIRAHATRLRQQ